MIKIKIFKEYYSFIRFLNNNYFGGKIIFNSDIFLETNKISDDGECFFNYGPILDTLDYAIFHGYLDNSTPFARLVHLLSIWIIFVELS